MYRKDIHVMLKNFEEEVEEENKEEEEDTPFAKLWTG